MRPFAENAKLGSPIFNVRWIPLSQADLLVAMPRSLQSYLQTWGGAKVDFSIKIQVFQ